MSIKLVRQDTMHAVNAMCVAAQVPGHTRPSEYEDQVIAFILALHKNAEREQTYKGLWEKDNLEEIGQHAVHKGKRMAIHSISMDEDITIADADDATDDALDLINYGAFCARKVHYVAREAGLTGPEEA